MVTMAAELMDRWQVFLEVVGGSHVMGAFPSEFEWRHPTGIGIQKLLGSTDTDINWLDARHKWVDYHPPMVKLTMINQYFR